MKKFSLSNLSKHALDKLHQNAVRGGSLPSCICGAISDKCSCPSGYSETLAEQSSYTESIREAGQVASERLDNPM